MKGSVQSCTRRRDDKFLIVIRGPGNAPVSGISETELRIGSDARIRDGKAVKA